MKFEAASKSELIEEYIVSQVLPKYASGEKIPSELELARELETSRPTIHKIFSNLTAKGVLYRENGVGTFISKPRLNTTSVTAVLSSVQMMSPQLNFSWFNNQYILEEFSRCAAAENVKVNVIYHQPEEASPKGLDSLVSLDTDFLIFTDPGAYHQYFPDLIAKGKKCIIRAPYASTVTHAVYGEVRKGTRMAVDYLIGQGRRRIAYFGLHVTGHGYEKERYSGFEDAMTAAGIPIRTEMVRTCGGFHYEARKEMENMLDEGHMPDAVFTTDMRAFGIMELLHERGIHIPDDIAVIGSDNLPECCNLSPGLSTVEYPMREMGQTMFDIFKILSKNPDHPIINRGLECRFLKRGSC